MKILFVYSVDLNPPPVKLLLARAEIQAGISYISSFLKAHGHQTQLIILNTCAGEKNKTVIDTFVKKYRPGLICFTAVSTQYTGIEDAAKFIDSRYPDIYLMIGGVHASLNPETIPFQYFDALCIGEGERPALELVSQLEKGSSPSGISGLWIKRGLKIEKNPPLPFLRNLDSLPFPDRQMWQGWTTKNTPPPAPAYTVLVGRGCPFTCAYCCNHKLRNISEGTYVRLRSVGNIISEVRQIAEGVSTNRDIYFEVESIDMNRRWAIELCSGLRRFNKTLKKPLAYSTNLRITPDKDPDGLFLSLKKGGFQSIRIGVESGSERIRSRILRRNYSNRDIINAVTSARKYGLKVHFYNMIGLPDETIADFEETVKINRMCLPDEHSTSIFFPYPGTDLYLVCKKTGLLNNVRLGDIKERKQAVFGNHGFSKDQIDLAFKFFNLFVYKGFSTQLLLNKGFVNSAIKTLKKPPRLSASGGRCGVPHEADASKKL